MNTQESRCDGGGSSRRCPPPTTNSIIPTAFLLYIRHPLQYARSSSYRRFTYSQSSSPPFISWRSTSASSLYSERQGKQPLAPPFQLLALELLPSLASHRLSIFQPPSWAKLRRSLQALAARLYLLPPPQAPQHLLDFPQQV